MKYNIWHIEMYHGWENCDSPNDCNEKGDYIFDARFNKQEVIDMMISVWDERMYVEVWKCELVKENQKLWLEDI